MVDIGFIPQPGPQQVVQTHGSLGEWWIHSEDYGPAAKGLMVRKTREDLRDTINAGMAMFGAAGVWKEKGSYFQMSNGGKLTCAYLESDQDAANYQGWSLTRVYVEELTQYAAPGPIFKLFACLRSAVGVPCQFRATCNPGGVGHHWVKAWAIDIGPYAVQGLGAAAVPLFVLVTAAGVVQCLCLAELAAMMPHRTGGLPSYAAETSLKRSSLPGLASGWVSRASFR